MSGYPRIIHSLCGYCAERMTNRLITICIIVLSHLFYISNGNIPFISNLFTNTYKPNLLNTLDNNNINNNQNQLKLYRFINKLIITRNNHESIELYINNQSNIIINSFNNKNKLYFTSNPVLIQSIDAIFGIYELSIGNYIALITNSNKINIFNDCNIRKVNEIILIRIPDSNTTSHIDNKYNSYSNKILELLLLQTLQRHTFYYSITKDYDITRNYQFNQLIRNKDSIDKFQTIDQRFYWNSNIVNKFISNGLNQWITPITNAFITTNNITINNRQLKLTLISRRSRYSQGPRYIKRGSDENGNVANFVETEQIVNDLNTNIISSFIQIRGSIPLYWNQSEIWQLKPKIRTYGSIDSHVLALKSHLLDLYYQYIYPYNSKQQQMLYFVNLIDKKNEQGLLGQLLYQTFEYLSSQLTNIRNTMISRNITYSININKSMSELSNHTFTFTIYNNDIFKYLSNSISNRANKIVSRFNTRLIWFDYHKQFKLYQVQCLIRLFDYIQSYFKSNYSFYCNDSNHSTYQCDIVRTNCVDCLDRTNVVQTAIGRWMLIRQLKYMKIVTDKDISDNAIQLPYQDVESVFREMWGDNGDYLSLLYAGTRALKRDVTRIGKRTNQGTLDDGINSLLRYYINNNIDPNRQKGLDIMLGTTIATNISRYSYPSLLEDQCIDNNRNKLTKKTKSYKVVHKIIKQFDNKIDQYLHELLDDLKLSLSD